MALDRAIHSTYPRSGRLYRKTYGKGISRGAGCCCRRFVVSLLRPAVPQRYADLLLCGCGGSLVRWCVAVLLSSWAASLLCFVMAIEAAELLCCVFA